MSKNYIFSTFLLFKQNEIIFPFLTDLTWYPSIFISSHIITNLTLFLVKVPSLFCLLTEFFWWLKVASLNASVQLNWKLEADEDVQWCPGGSEANMSRCLRLVHSPSVLSLVSEENSGPVNSGSVHFSWSVYIQGDQNFALLADYQTCGYSRHTKIRVYFYMYKLFT